MVLLNGLLASLYVCTMGVLLSTLVATCVAVSAAFCRSACLSYMAFASEPLSAGFDGQIQLGYSWVGAAVVSVVLQGQG